MSFHTVPPLAGPSVALVRNKRQLAKARAFLGINLKHAHAPRWEDTDGVVGLTWSLEVDGAPYWIVYVADQKDPAQVIGVMAHEAVHVMRAYLRHIVEDTPGEETEAYTVQGIVATLVRQYAASKRRKA